MDPRLSPAVPAGVVPEALLLVGPDATVGHANPAAVNMVGGDPQGLPLAAVLPDARLAGWLAGGREGTLRLRIRGERANGVPYAADLTAVAHGEGAILLLRELDDRHAADQARRLFDAAFDCAPIGMVLCNTNGAYTRVNQAFCEMLGRAAEELLGRRAQEFTHPEDRAGDVDAAWRILHGELDSWQCEKRFVHRSGESVWVIANMTFVRDERRHPLTWFGQFQDISERKRTEDRLHHLAERDPLTGALNRRGLEAALERAIAEPPGSGALLVLDLDRFKELNDRFGHRAGDEALREVSRSLRRRLRVDDTVARIGGDEFAVVLPATTAPRAEAVAQDLCDGIRGLQFDWDPSLVLDASVGVASFRPDRGSRVSDLLAWADEEMYRGKRARPDLERSL